MMPFNLTTKPSFLKMEQRYFHVYQQPNYQPCPDISFQRKVGLLNTFRPLQPEVIHESVPNNNGNSPPFLTSPDWKTGETHFTNHLMREEKSQQAGKSFSIEAILGLPSDKNPENLRRNLTIKTEPEVPLRANCHFHSKCCPEKQGCEGYLDYSQQMRVSPDSTAIDYRLNSTNNQSGKGSKTPLFHQLFSSNGNFRRQDTEMEEDCKGTKMGKSRHLKGKDGRTLFGKQMKTPARGDERSSKTKRVRTIFTPEQLDQLEIEFQRQQYMVGDQRKYVAGSLRLTEAQVKVWFQNRRIKYRKQQKEGLQVTRFRIQTESEDSETETQSPA